ncbi:MAG: hypothetical protein EOP55_08770 [Sphingobacteriales bacterium]|nr:MAG: hypothetical protein EOP55_08770 [Sphingobacteriales bacterium]
MRKMDKELIDHIKDSLHAHEEAYTPGAWERFSAPEEKKRRGFVYWPLWSAAAIILVIGSIFFLQNHQSNNQNVVVKTSKPIINQEGNSDAEPSLKEESDVSETNKLSSLENKTPSAHRNSDYSLSEKSSQNFAAGKVVTARVFNTTQGKSNDFLTLNALTSKTELYIGIYSERIAGSAVLNQPKLEKKRTPQPTLTFEQLLEQDSHKSSLAKTSKSNNTTKWEPGVFVAPSMGNDNKVKMNYGFSLSYNLADKLSINSGIAYASISTTSNPSSSMGSTGNAAASLASGSNAVAYSSASKSLQSINANVRGINIPVELKYKISNKFYTGVGVSALAVADNRQEKNYIVSSAQNTSVANTYGITEQKMLIVTEKVSEPQNKSATTDKLIGFYNFSLGYKQKISKKNNFAVEPFLRVPMKTFSGDKLNLTNGGVRLKFDF